MDKINYIYLIENKLNGKIYIGKHTTKNINDGYMGSGLLIKRAIKKYGIENFKKTIIQFCDSNDLDTLEKEYIEKLNITKSYNIGKGGNGGDIISNHPNRNEIIQKISKNLKGIKRSEDFKNKLRKKKPKRTKEHINKIIEKTRGKNWYYNPLTNESKKFKNDEVLDGWIKGRPKIHIQKSHTLESNKKRSESLLGRKKSTETREKIKKTLMGHLVKNETREKISQTLKKKNYSSIFSHL